MARTNTNTGGGGGGGAFSSITGTPTTIAYFDALGLGTGDLDHTLLADGTLNLESTFGDVTGKFVQRLEPTLGNLGIWGTTSTNNSTGATITHAVIDGTNTVDVGNDSVLLTIAEFPATSTAVQQFVGSAGILQGISVGADIIIEENITSAGYELGVYDTSIPTGSNIFAFSNGAGLTSRNLTSNSTGYPVYAIYGSTYVDDTGVTSRVQTGKDIVDYVQNGTFNSAPVFTGTGTDDFSVSGAYTGAYTGTYTVTCIGNDGARVVFNGGMTTGTQFAEGEVVTGSISGATAVVSNGTSDTRIWAYDVTGTGFVNGDILTGDQGNVSTAVTTAGNAPGVGDLFVINYTDISNTNIEWFTGNQSPFPGIGGINFIFTTPTGHTPNDEWAFTSSALYEEKQKVDATGTVFSNNANGTNTHSQDIPITVKYTLTAAELTTIGSVPIEVVPAPGAGYMIQQIGAYSKYNFNTTNWVQGGALLVTRYTNDALGAGNTFFLNGGAQVITAAGQTNYNTFWGSGTPTAQLPTTVENQGISIQTDDVSDPTGAGDGTLDFYITYKVITL